MKTIICGLFYAVLIGSAVGQGDDKSWQTKAVVKYPNLGVQGSDFNKRFVDAYNQLKRTNPAFFNNPQWPVVLADELAATNPVDAIKSIPSTPSKAEDRVSHNVVPKDKDGSETATIGTIAFVLLMLMMGSLSNKSRRIKADARRYIALADRERGLPRVSTNVILKAGESAFYCAPASLYETRAVRQYQSGFAGFRIAKGIYIGGSRGHSFSTQEWSIIDDGTLVITNRRLIFTGSSADRSLNLSKILDVHPMKDAVDISAEGRQKGMAFSAANPLILAVVLRICAEVEDPLDLGNTTLNIKIK